MIEHPFLPIFNSESEILILGSFPSVKSRETSFYYGHKENRFWKVIARIYNVEAPTTIAEKTNLLLDNKIAIWDTIKSCDIHLSSDSSIKNVTPNDLSIILNNSKVHKIYTNGSKSYELYMKYIYPLNNIEAIKLPSTSPLNAKYSLEMLVNEWKIIKQ